MEQKKIVARDVGSITSAGVVVLPICLSKCDDVGFVVVSEVVECCNMFRIPLRENYTMYNIQRCAPR